MELGKYIWQLLKHRNEVYVKGLGVFRRIHTSSVFDEQKEVYLPPVSYLEFDSQSVQGVDLVEYVQQTNQSTRADAEEQVAAEVLQLFETIKDAGSVQLNHLGQFIKHGSSIVFKPEDLSSFNYQPIVGSAKQETTIPEPVSAPIEEPLVEQEVKEEVELAEDPKPNADEPVLAVEPELVEYDQPKKSLAVYIWVTLIALAVIGSLFYYNSLKDKKIEEVENLPLDSIQDTKVDSTNILPVDTTLTVKVDSLVKQDSVAKVEKKPLIPANHKYLIVIGTHATLAQAYEQAESFNKAGIKSVRVIPSNLAHNKKKVIWDSYETNTQADSALRYVQKRYVSDAWKQPLK